MAKSSRSKSERRSKAILYARVFKPVEDARTARLSAKLQSIPSLPQYDLKNRMEAVSTPAVPVTGASTAATYKSKTQSLLGIGKPTPKKNRMSKRELRNAKVYEEFNVFGVSKKELKF